MTTPLAGPSMRVCAPPEWEEPGSNSPSSSTIDPVYMIQQIVALNEANRPLTAGSSEGAAGISGSGAAAAAAGGGDSDDEDDEESNPSIAAAKRLWDLAAGDARAAFLVENHMHEVALGILTAHERHRPRLCELCMGCLANLASVAEVAPILAASEELVTVVLRVWMTCPDALVLSETARLHLAFTSCAATSELWRRHLSADEPLNQLVCLAMSAKEPLLLARLCAVIQQMLRDMPVAYHLVGRCHFAVILTHLLDSEVPESASNAAAEGGADSGGRKRGFEEIDDENEETGGLREGALRQTPWSRGAGRAFGAQTATLADQAVDSGGLQSALFFLLHAAEVLSYFSQEAVLSSGAAPANGAGSETANDVRCCPAQELAKQPALPRILTTVVRRTKGKGGLGRAALATLDYMLDLPEEKSGWQMQSLTGAAPAFAALAAGVEAAVEAIQTSAEGLLAADAEELDEFRMMVGLAWGLLAKAIHLDVIGDAGAGAALRRLVLSDQLASALCKAAKASLVDHSKALLTLSCLCTMREKAGGGGATTTTMELRAAVESLEETQNQPLLGPSRGP